jgi:hypothetical protein
MSTWIKLTFHTPLDTITQLRLVLYSFQSASGVLSQFVFAIFRFPGGVSCNETFVANGSGSKSTHSVLGRNSPRHARQGKGGTIFVFRYLLLVHGSPNVRIVAIGGTENRDCTTAKLV